MNLNFKEFGTLIATMDKKLAEGDDSKCLANLLKNGIFIMFSPFVIFNRENKVQ